MAYDAVERETVLQTDDESGMWRVYSRQRKVISKLLKMDSFEETYRIEEDGRVVELEGMMPYKAMTFRINTKSKRKGGNLPNKA